MTLLAPVKEPRTIQTRKKRKESSDFSEISDEEEIGYRVSTRRRNTRNGAIPQRE